MKLFFITILLTISTISYSNELKNYEFTYQDEDLIIAFTLDKEANTEIFNLKNPFRLILTLKDTGLSDKIKPKNEINNEILKNIMAVQFSRNGQKNSKIIISLKKEVAYTLDKFNNRILLILKNVKTFKQDKIAQKIEENEKKIIETPQKVKLKNILTDISYQYIDEDLVISLKTAKPTTYKAFELVSPFRIFLDINNVDFSSSLKKEIKYNDEYLQKAIINRISRNGKSKVRISFFFKDKKMYTIEQIKNNTIITVRGAKKLKTVAINQEEKIEEEAKEEIQKEIQKEGKLSNEKLIDYNYNDNSLLIAIKLKNDEELKSYHLTEPFRIILDIQNTSFFKERKKEIKYDDKYIKNIKFIKYKKAGKFNTKVIILFNKYAPYEVEKINKTILITLSNIINVPETTNDETSNIATNENTEETPEETISFKKTKEQEKLKEEVDESLNNNDISLDEKAPVIKTTSSGISGKKHNLLNKIVFKKYKNKARIIIKTQNAAAYQTELSGNTFSIILENTSFGSRMASLTLNTEFFKTNVKKIIPKNKGKNIVIKLNLSKSKSPKIKQSGNQLFLDF